MYLQQLQQRPFAYIFYSLSATRVLNSFEQLCIMRAAAENSFAKVLICIGINLFFQVDLKFSS